MDTNKLSGIDPKLQEAYNKVMSTPIATLQPSTTQNPTTPPPPLPTLTPIGGSKNASSAGKPNNTPVPVGMVAKSGSGISPAILVVAAVIFFLVYALFWIKLFNVS